jgi:hypothetical protein
VWLRMRAAIADASTRGWKGLWSVTTLERLRLRCSLDAMTAELYGLGWDDLAWIVRECDYSAEAIRDGTFARALDPKGFWRVGKDTVPELRHSVLTLAAFRDLKETIAEHGHDRARGIEAFCGQNDGDGWIVPEMLCLDDLGLGHDERAKRPQPVSERLGERFYPWQLEQSVDESWAECERHARNLLGAAGFARLERELRGEVQALREPAEPALLRAAEPSVPYTPDTTGMPPAQRRLFPGDPDLFGERSEDPPARQKPRRRP